MPPLSGGVRPLFRREKVTREIRGFDLPEFLDGVIIEPVVAVRRHDTTMPSVFASKERIPKLESKETLRQAIEVASEETAERMMRWQRHGAALDLTDERGGRMRRSLEATSFGCWE
jgi:hypothetical protein